MTSHADGRSIDPVELDNTGSGSKGDEPSALRRFVSFVRDVIEAHLDNEADVASAAIAFWAVLSLAPMAVIAVAVASFIYQGAEARQAIVGMLGRVLDAEGVAWLMSVMAEPQSSSVLVSVGSFAVSLWAASRLFACIQTTLNQIWGVRQADEDERIREQAKRVVRKRLWSFAMVLATGLAVAVVLVAQTAMDEIGSWLGWHVQWLWHVANTGLGLVVLGALIAALFKVLPDVRLAWRDVWIGAGVTTVLLTLGVFGLALYFRHAAPESVLGAAGTLGALLLWVYYSAQIFFLGAQVTFQGALAYGRGVVPDAYAVLSGH